MKPDDAPTAPPREDQDALAERLRQLRAAPLTEVPTEAAALHKRLAEVAELRDYAEETGDAFTPEAWVYLWRLQAALQYEAALTEGRAVLEIARQEPDVTAKTYLLQACEGTVRQGMVLESQVGSEWAAQGRTLLAALKAESERLREQAQREESEAAWAAFEREYLDPIRAVEKWKPTTNDKLDGACTRQVRAVQEAMQAVQRVLPRLTHLEVQQRATDLLEKLGKQLESALVAQQRRYSLHAMAVIRKGYMEGIQHAGVIDNEQSIARALIDHLGSLDVRHLTSEVQRCYGEVFEYLYGRLDRPGKTKAFESDTNKLYALKKMFETKKTALDEA